MVGKPLAGGLTSLAPKEDALPPLSAIEATAHYWSAATYADMPSWAVASAKLFMLDTFAAGVAGATTPVGLAAYRGAAASLAQPGGPAVAWGNAGTLPIIDAALVNGTAAHAQELDDFGGCGHPGAVVVPTICALSGLLEFSGQDAIAAMVAGYDVSARVVAAAGGYRRHNDRGWHSTGTCGSFGAAAAAARLLALPQGAFADALGIAGSFTGGIWAYLADSAMTKHLHPGKAAETGLRAAFLAKAGMTGPRQVMEAEWGGFCSTYVPDGSNVAAMTKDLGSDFLIRETGIKIYSCCRGLHYPIDGVLDMMDENAADDEALAGIVVRCDLQAAKQFDRPDPRTLLDAQFSFQYCLALAAIDRRVELDQFKPLRTGDPRIAGLMRRIEVRMDADMVSTDRPVVTLVFKDGRKCDRQVTAARGGPDNPVSTERVIGKARALMEPLLGQARCDSIIDATLSLERLDDFRKLANQLQPTGSL